MPPTVIRSLGRDSDFVMRGECAQIAKQAAAEVTEFYMRQLPGLIEEMMTRAMLAYAEAASTPGVDPVVDPSAGAHSDETGG